MGSYIPNTSEKRWEMLREIGLDSFEALFSHIPQDIRVKDGLKLPEGPGEMKVIGKMKEVAQQNVVLKYIFRGVGAYNHYIPAVIESAVSKEEFLTPYTPYQAGTSQGILQSTFEYQTILCGLAGMDVPNVSVYDGATAVAEAAAMCRDRKRSRAYLSAITHPQVIEIAKTYYFGSGAQVVMIPEEDGVTGVDALRELLDDAASCFYVQQPNYYGNLEEYGLLGEIVHEEGAKYTTGYNPTFLALLSTPAECGADIVVGDGQPPGIPLCFGGSYLDFMTATSAMGRRLPGRIVGETRDVNGERAYVLTLRAREQHIRREKVSSDVYLSQVLYIPTASIYMAAMGGEGSGKATIPCISKVHYLKERLGQASLTARYGREFFHELVTGGDTNDSLILEALEEKGILGGLSLNDREILWCAIEQDRRGDIDQTVQIAEEVCGG